MRTTLLFLMGFVPPLLFSQSIQQLEQQLQNGVDAYANFDIEAAINILSKSVKAIDPNRYPVLAAKAHCYLGECYFENQQEVLCDQNFLRSDQLLMSSQVNTDTLDFYYRILLYQALIADYNNKPASYQNVTEWVENFPNPDLRLKGTGLYSQGMYYLYTGNYDLAFRALEESLSIQEPLGRDPFLGNDHSTMAYLAADFQDYYSAVTHQRIAVDLASRQKPAVRFRKLISLAGYQMDNRSLADARQTINRAKKIGHAEVSPDYEFWKLYYDQQREYFNTDLNLDSLKFYQEQAEIFYNRYPEHQQTDLYHNHLNFATGIAIRSQDYEQAAESIKRTFMLFPAEGQRSEELSSTLFLRSKVEIANEQFAEGVNTIQSLLKNKSSLENIAVSPDYLFSAKELRAEPLVIEYLKDKASYYNQWDRVDSTKNRLELSSKTIQLADSLITIIKQANSQAGLRKQLDEISRELRKIEVENYYRRYQRTGNVEFIELAVNSSEQVKHLIISERLHENILSKSYGLKDELINKERSYNAQLTNDLVRVSRGGTIDSVDVLLARISKTRDLQKELRAEIIQNYPRFASLRYSPAPISLEKIRREFIGEDEVLLHFLERERSLYLIGITKEEQIFRRIQLAQPLAVTSPLLIRQMETMNDSVTILLRSHYREIMEPLEGFIQDKDLVIIPDAYLWHLPFPALITKDATEGTPCSGQEYLIQKKYIRHLFSLRVGMLQNSLRDEGAKNLQTVLSFSPFTEQSFGNFSRLANSANTEQLLKEMPGLENGYFLSGPAATRKAFLDLGANARLLHIFSHAQVSEVRPDSSYLMFNPGGGSLQAGYLTALDIYNTKLSAQLAVLAACKTAGGKYYQGQGIANLARAFAHAGCENLVVNLWESKSEVIEQLLASFYPAVLEKNQTVSVALAEAQRDFITKNTLSAHPGYWGMAIYIGKRESIDLINETKISWVEVGVVSTALVFFAALFGIASMKSKYS